MLSVMAPAIAEVEVPVKDTDVTVNGLMNGDIVKFYQVLTWNQTAGEWQLAAGFEGLTAAAYNDIFATDSDNDTSRAQEVLRLLSLALIRIRPMRLLPRPLCRVALRQLSRLLML